MDTLLNESVNIFEFNSESFPSFSSHQNSITRIRNGNYVVVDNPLIFHTNDQRHDLNPHMPSDIRSDPYSGVNPDGEMDEISDYCLKFISEILMEEDLDDQTASLHDFTALQSTEKSLYDAIGETFPSSSDEYPLSLGQNNDNPDDNSHEICSRHWINNNHGTCENRGSSSVSLSSSSCDSFNEVVKGLADSPVTTLLYSESTDESDKFDWFKEVSQYTPHGGCNESRGRKNLTRDDEEGRRNKHLATYTEEYVQMEQYDDVFLCKEDAQGNLCCQCKDIDGSSDDGESINSKGYTKRKKTRSKKRSYEGEVVDLMTLLTQCAQAVASFDLRNANELLNKIRVHSSQYGDSTQRVTHYLGNALEARLAGTGWQQYRSFGPNQILRTSQVLKAYREQVSAIPFRRASYYMANDSITKLGMKATRIHIIDFGIFFGFQWPGLIQMLSKRSTGPPMLRITAIDVPESGFRPAQRVEETGRRLQGYCDRFKVPFRYQAIAKNWDHVTLDDIDIERDELVVVNCLYMARKLVDETVEENNPRDSFFKLIRKLKPSLFIHGIVNGTYGSPFFMTRFREALFHYSSIFDMFEATMPRESEERLLVESHLHGRDALNVIACEGAERVERPETYRQWQVRIQKAGFRKLPLDYDLVQRMKAHVKMNHHKDFVVDEDSHWMLQGWKGRILYAISCWRPA